MDKDAVKFLKKDSVMAKIIAGTEIKPLRNEGYEVYRILVRSVVGQQLSVKAANTIYGRFLEFYDGKNPEPDVLANADIPDLRSVGLSNQKSNYVKNIAGYFSKKENANRDWNVTPDEDIIKDLTSIKGVGVWTVQMLLMFGLHRPDVFPIGDLAIRQSMIFHYSIDGSLPKRELYGKLEEIASTWSPYRSVACRYLWAAKNNSPI